MIWLVETFVFFFVGRAAAFYVLGPDAFVNIHQTMEIFAISSIFGLFFGTRIGSEIFYDVLLMTVFAVRNHEAAKESKATTFSEKRIKKFYGQLGIKYVKPREPYYDSHSYGGEP